MNGATYVNVDVALLPQNGSPMLVIEGTPLETVKVSWLVLVVLSKYSDIYEEEHQCSLEYVKIFGICMLLGFCSKKMS